MLTLHRLNLGYRILYSGVLVFMTAGTWIHGVHQHARAGLWPAQVAAWYRGNADDPNAPLLLFPRSFEEVIGDVSLTLGSYALALLIFGTILYRSDARPALRTGLLTGYAVGGILAGVAPFLIRYASPLFAWIDTVALLLLPLFALAMTLLALHDLWMRRAAGLRVDPRPV